jgi:hypothetical protein
MFQRGPGCAVEFDFCFLVGGGGGDQIEFGEGKVALGGYGLKARSGA